MPVQAEASRTQVHRAPGWQTLTELWEDKLAAYDTEYASVGAADVLCCVAGQALGGAETKCGASERRDPACRFGRRRLRA